MAKVRIDDGRIYGGLLLGAALLSGLGALHHPRIEGRHDLASALRILSDEQGLVAGVHGF